MSSSDAVGPAATLGQQSEGGFDTRRLLAHATRQKEERRYSEFVIVDADCHHYETESWAEISTYIEQPIVQQMAQASARKGTVRPGLLVPQVGNQDLGGRITRYQLRSEERTPGDEPRDVTLVRRAMDAMGIDYTILFPTPMLSLGLNPQTNVEVALARAYAHWLTDRVLPAEPRIKTMLYLPLNDAEASLRMVEEFGDRPGVVGFMITSLHYRPVHDNQYMKVYAALQERRLPLAFHPVYNWQERSMELFNKFISVHALGFPLYNMVHLINWVVNGMPERFPRLPVIWMESGLAWVLFLMQRLDNEYRMRSSECPLLRRLPSEYMREFYYTSQPMERPDNPELLRVLFEELDAERHLVYASDYPHWDFDLPSVVYDLPFLSEEGRRSILGGNACKLFGLENRKPASRQADR